MLSRHRLTFMEGEDSAEVLVRFADGSIGTLTTSWAYEPAGSTEKFSVVGEAGSLWSDGLALFHQPRGGEVVQLVDPPTRRDRDDRAVGARLRGVPARGPPAHRHRGRGHQRAQGDPRRVRLGGPGPVDRPAGDVRTLVDPAAGPAAVSRPGRRGASATVRAGSPANARHRGARWPTRVRRRPAAGACWREGERDFLGRRPGGSREPAARCIAGAGSGPAPGPGRRPRRTARRCRPPICSAREAAACASPTCRAKTTTIQTASRTPIRPAMRRRVMPGDRQARQVRDVVRVDVVAGRVAEDGRPGSSASGSASGGMGAGCEPSARG